jgi:microcystin-dependent protein
MGFAGRVAPNGWLICNGEVLDSTQEEYKNLFAAIGRDYVPVLQVPIAQHLFAVPDMRGRVIVGMDSIMGLNMARRVEGSNNLGMFGGEEKHALKVEEMAPHNHHLKIKKANRAPGIWESLCPSSSGSSDMILNNGAGQPHNNMPPYLILNYIIKK